MLPRACQVAPSMVIVVATIFSQEASWTEAERVTMMQ